MRFLKEAGVLQPEAAKAADKLGQLRNRYAHARGVDAKADALEAVRLLHAIVDDTVSVFKDFEIQDGALVPKTSGSGIVET